MQENFCEWYRTVCVDPTNERLKYRWESLQEYCELEEIDVLELVKMFFGLQTYDSFKKEFVDFYSSKDMTFLSKNEREISLLAGATLIELIEKELYVTEIVLATMCIILFKKDAIIPEVETIVSEKLGDITANIRELENEQIIDDISDVGLTTLKKSLESPAWNDDNIAKLLETISRISNNFNMIRKNQKGICKLLSIYKEDSDILSWLFGAWSNDLDIPLNGNIKQSQMALVFGKELADLVKQTPGPYSAKAFLKKMLGYCKAEKKKFSLAEMIDILDVKWKEQLLDGYNVIKGGENTPILLAVSKSLEADEPSVWKHTYQKVMGINAEEVISDPLTWGYQLYLECILVKYYNSEE